MSRPHQIPLRVDPETFRRACAQFATGVAVATVLAPDGSPHGLTVNSFTSVSLDPPLILICIGDQCQILPHFEQSGWFALNILKADQEELSNSFARRTDNRFEDCAWEPGETGMPLIPDVLASIECRKVQILHVGDHAVFVGEVVISQIREGSPLLYFARSYRTLP